MTLPALIFLLATINSADAATNLAFDAAMWGTLRDMETEPITSGKLFDTILPAFGSIPQLLAEKALIRGFPEKDVYEWVSTRPDEILAHPASRAWVTKVVTAIKSVPNQLAAWPVGTPLLTAGIAAASIYNSYTMNKNMQSEHKMLHTKMLQLLKDLEEQRIDFADPAFPTRAKQRAVEHSFLLVKQFRNDLQTCYDHTNWMLGLGAVKFGSGSALEVALYLSPLGFKAKVASMAFSGLIAASGLYDVHKGFAWKNTLAEDQKLIANSVEAAWLNLAEYDLVPQHSANYAALFPTLKFE